MVSMAVLHDGPLDRPIAMLSPLGVVPDAQHQGIGSALVDEVAARAEKLGEPLVVLEGDPAFYGRLGFEYSVPHGIHITLPSWARPECAQVRLLRTGGPAFRGRVVYPPAFDIVAD
jgi:putative acetyltransferase